MIFLKKYKIIFIKPTRVGGSSFEVCLSKFANKDDIITPIKREEVRDQMGFLKPRNFKYSMIETIKVSKILFAKSLLQRSMPRKFYNHMPAIEIKNKLGDKIWNESLKVSIIRNPFDQLISYYFRTIKKNNLQSLNFSEWCKNNPSILTQNKPHYQINGKNIIDFFIKFENFERDILNLEKKIPEITGLYNIFKNTYAPAYAGSRPQNLDIKKFYENAPEIKKLVEILNYDDINNFNYTL
ncbi:sulfotransferase family protein [Candidatus Pelagibacter sp.]|nr:sulfotransferase family protein [Candidatus Pelagibacter sp.]